MIIFIAFIYLNLVFAIFYLNSNYLSLVVIIILHSIYFSILKMTYRVPFTLVAKRQGKLDFTLQKELQMKSNFK